MHRKESILFVIDQFVNPYAGTESQLFKLLENMPQLGFQPHLLVLRDSLFVRDGKLPCEVSVLPHYKLRDPRTWWHLWRFARQMRRKNGVRLAHIFFNDASVLCPPVFHFSGLRTLISRRDLGYWYTPPLLKLLRITRRWVAGVVVNSEAVSRVTHVCEGYDQKLISVIYNGYENVEGPPDSTVPELEQIGQTGPIAFLVANIRPIKRIQDAISAVALLKERGRHLNLVVIGGGDTLELQVQARRQGVGAQILFAGSRSDVSVWLRYGFVGLSCSESEGYSNAVVEYMQAGLPVVATDVGGNCEAVTEGKTGWRFTPGDTETLARRLADLLDNPEQASAMGAAGRRVAEERHGLERMLQAHFELYQSLVRGLPEQLPRSQAPEKCP